jgi:hypothetical protein
MIDLQILIRKRRVIPPCTFMDNELDRDWLRELAKGRLEGRWHSKEWSIDDHSKLIEELIIHQEELNIQNGSF